MLLTNRVALVTGAGSGIGRAVARAYAREGAFVILLGRRQKPLTETYDLIHGEGGEATIAPLDLESQLNRVAELAEGIYRRFGRLDILVNNAGELGTLTPLASFEPMMWEKVFRINLTAPFFLTRELMPLLRQAEAASVIQVVSGLAFHGRAYWGAYAASKAALANLTESWAQELAHSTIRMNTVNPGSTATTMRAKAFPGEDPATLPTADAITPLFLYLASQQSQGVTGKHFNARDWKEHPASQST
ncbi:MAG: SDR family NAD(P)-dependent oxidoreductase [Magnetococcales bacterium]|nr:SDR family NAD(P)-dependent oxidoreductase [Magnetococcales bacterium]NGZ26213.1 SDR family NAD(P)-dependent oxidoreductase [Magnetococcales bacterium]